MVKCPKCGKEMETGFMINRSGYQVASYWTKEKDRTILTLVKDKVKLKGFDITRFASNFPAHICKTDRLLVVDYSSPDNP